MLIKNSVLKYLLAIFIGVAICIIVITISWDKPPAYTPFVQGSATLNFSSTAAGASSDLTMTVTGATDGDPVMLAVPNGSTVANGVFSAWISASNTATVRFTNTNLLTALDPASGTFMVMVCKGH